MGQNPSREYQKWYRKKNYRTLNLTVRNNEMSRLKALSEMYAETHNKETNLIRYILELAEKDAKNYDPEELKRRTTLYEETYNKETEAVPDWVPRDNPIRKHRDRNLIWPHCDINPDQVAEQLKIGSSVIVHKFAETRYIRNWQDQRTGKVTALKKKTATIKWDPTDEDIPYFESESSIPYECIEITSIYGFNIGDMVKICATKDSKYKKNDGTVGVVVNIKTDVDTKIDIVTISTSGKNYKAEYFCIQRLSTDDLLQAFKK